MNTLRSEIEELILQIRAEAKDLTMNQALKKYPPKFEHLISTQVEEAEKKAYIQGVEDELKCVRAGGHTDIFTDHTSSDIKWLKEQS